MQIKSLLASVLLALPWMLGATLEPVAQLGAWGVAALVLVVVLLTSQLQAWPQSVVLAAGLTAGIGAVQFVGAADGLAPWVYAAAPGELLGNLRQRNQFASLMVMGLLGLLVLFSGKQSAAGTLVQQRWALGWVCALAAPLMLGNALSGSRTGLLQFVTVLALGWVWRGAGVAKVLAAAAVAYGLGVLLAPWLAQLLGHANAGLLGRADDANALSRLALWSNVLELIAQQPWAGHGWRSLAYAHYSNDFSGERFMELLDNAHNLPLHLAVELGLPVALGFCALLVWGVWRGKPWRETRPDRQFAWGCLMVLGIHSLLEYPLWYGPFFLTTWLCIGVLGSDLWRNWLLAQTESAQSAIILGVRGLGVMLLACTAFAAFDYHRVSQIYLQPEQRSRWYADDALGAAQQSVLFTNHAKFAELMITPLSRETAPRVLSLASELVRWSPEPRVIEKLIESSVMMGVDDLAAFHLKRYAKAYPAAYAAWSVKPHADKPQPG